MRNCVLLIGLAAMLTGCEVSSLEGSWRHERGGLLTFRDDGSLILNDANRVYSGKYKVNWKNKYSSEVALTIDGFPGREHETCNFQITDDIGGRTLWIEGCTFSGILKKQ